MSQPIALKKHDRCAFCGKSDATYQQVVEALKSLTRFVSHQKRELFDSSEEMKEARHALAAAAQGEAHA